MVRAAQPWASGRWGRHVSVATARCPTVTGTLATSPYLGRGPKRPDDVRRLMFAYLRDGETYVALLLRFRRGVSGPHLRPRPGRRWPAVAAG